jgi:chromosome segregation ATPase
MVEGDAPGHRDRPPRFDIVVHGYNQRQVNERVTRLEFDLRNAVKARDAALAQVSELTELLATVRTERDQLADSQLDDSRLSERVRAMMQLAQEEIAELRHTAEEQAKSTIEEADREAATRVAAHRRRAAELEGEHHSLVAELRAEAERTKADLYEKSATELQERRARLERQYAEAHETLNAEHEDLRAALTREHENLMAEARAEAAVITNGASEEAEKLRHEVIEQADRRIAQAKASTAELRALHEDLTTRFAAAHVAAQRAVEHLTQEPERTAGTGHETSDDERDRLASALSAAAEPKSGDHESARAHLPAGELSR